jgi:hypothetical protein
MRSSRSCEHGYGIQPGTLAGIPSPGGADPRHVLTGQPVVAQVFLAAIGSPGYARGKASPPPTAGGLGIDRASTAEKIQKNQEFLSTSRRRFRLGK